MSAAAAAMATCESVGRPGRRRRPRPRPRPSPPRLLSRSPHPARRVSSRSVRRSVGPLGPSAVRPSVHHSPPPPPLSASVRPRKFAAAANGDVVSFRIFVRGAPRCAGLYFEPSFRRDRGTRAERGRRRGMTGAGPADVTAGRAGGGRGTEGDAPGLPRRPPLAPSLLPSRRPRKVPLG